MSTLLPQAILESARRDPDATAVLCEGRLTDYRTLTTRAAGIAQRLRPLLGSGESVVAVAGGRHEDTLAALLGCWFAGAAYVPVDPEQPIRRVEQILTDCAPDVLLVDEAARQALRPLALDLPVVSMLSPSEPSLHEIDLPEVAATNLAHVLYTSGSTGRPKGVLTTFGDITGFVRSVAGWAPGVGPGMRTAGVSSFGFDAATYDLFVPWHVGGAVVLVTGAERTDPARLTDALRAGQADFGFFTPTLLATLEPRQVPQLRTVVCGGEVVPAHVIGAWARDPARHVFDAYGPTEATVSQTAVRLAGREVEPLPIGTALPGRRVHVVGTDGRPVAHGEIGELCIGGLGVARGYLGRPGRTAQVFVPEPGRVGARMYRTGDLVRATERGLLYVGRLDDQVKIRGQRVEPGEAEACLRRAPGLAEAVVVAMRRGGDVELVAVVAPADVDVDRLRGFAAQRLPSVLVPARILAVDRLPTAVSGKVDRQAVTALASGGGTAAGSGDEIRDLWQQLLGVEADEDDDFFALGGHSVTAMRLAAAVHQRWGRTLRVEDVYRRPTLADLRELVRTAAPAESGLPGESRPVLTAAQARLWFVDQFDPNAVAYNVAFVARLSGDPDPARLRRAVDLLAQRHEILRWRVREVDGAPEAHLVNTAPGLTVRDCDAVDRARAVDELSAHRFDLAEGPTWTATLLQHSPGDATLVLAFHHAVVDGWSQKPLYADLGALYRQEEPSAAVGFSRYARWRTDRDRARGAQDLRWWIEHLSGAALVLDLPTDRPRPAAPTHTGCRLRLPLGAVRQSLRAMSSRLGATEAAVLLAAIAEVLRRYAATDEVLIGGFRSERPFLELEDTVGFFVDMLPYRLTGPGPGDDFAALVRRAAVEMDETAQHSAAPFQDIVAALHPPRDTGRAPLIQVAFNVYNFPEPRLDLGDGVEVVEQSTPIAGSPFDLTFYLVTAPDGAALDLVYDPDLFDAERIERIGGAVLALLEQVGVDVHAAPADLALDLPDAGAVRAATGEPPEPQALRPATETLSPTEERVCEAWESVLGGHPGPLVNFFDAGADSLTIVRFARALSSCVGRDVPVITPFQYPTVRDLAAYLDQTDTASDSVRRASSIAAARRARARRRSRT